MSTEPENNSLPSDPPSLVSGAQDPTPTPTDPNAAPPVEPPKLDEPPAPAPAAPEPITFEALKVPEGFQVDEATQASLLEAINTPDLPPAERAQKLLDLGANLVQKVHEDNYAAWTTQQTAWQDEVRADPEIGGEKLPPVLGEISKLLDTYGTPEVRQIMDATGAGNNIHVVKMLHKIAKDLSEGGPVSGAPSLPKESLAERMYPSMKPKQGA